MRWQTRIELHLYPPRAFELRRERVRVLSVLFFFSSRRRHTRSLCDWSSDVCSSDLGAPKLLDVRDFSGEGVVRLTPVTPTGDGTVAVAGRALAGAGRIGRLTTATTWYAGVLAERPLGKVRSEERRVGKGGRARRGA